MHRPLDPTRRTMCQADAANMVPEMRLSPPLPRCELQPILPQASYFTVNLLQLFVNVIFWSASTQVQGERKPLRAQFMGCPQWSEAFGLLASRLHCFWVQSLDQLLRVCTLTERHCRSFAHDFRYQFLAYEGGQKSFTLDCKLDGIGDRGNLTPLACSKITRKIVFL